MDKKDKTQLFLAKHFTHMLAVLVIFSLVFLLMPFADDFYKYLETNIKEVICRTFSNC